MPSLTLAESAKLTQNLLVAGIIENIVTVNPFFEVLPFMEIQGNALQYNREQALGDVQFAGVDDIITAKNPASFKSITASLTTLIGDAEVNGLIQATRSNYTDQEAVQIASKAKSIARQYQQTMIIGDGTNNTFQGFNTLAGLSAGVSNISVTGGGSNYAQATTSVAITGGGGSGATANVVVSSGAVTAVIVTNAGTGYTSVPTVTITDSASGTGATATATITQPQILVAGNNGASLSFDILDQGIDSIKDKDGQADFILAPARTIRSYYALLRALGGASIGDVVTLPSGRTVPAYRGVPIFRNDYIPTNVTQGSSSNNTGSIYIGTLDDGSGTHGVSGITAEGEAGIRVNYIGESETKDNSITRVKFYSGLANFSELGLIQIKGLTN